MGDLFSIEISMSYLWVGVFSYLLSHGVHIVLWRSSPNRSLIRLFTIFFALPGLVTACLLLFRHHGQYSLTEMLPPLWLHLVASLHYIMIYPAFQARSPTVQILNALNLSKNGLTKNQLVDSLDQASLHKDRFDDLTQSKLLKRRGEQWKLTVAGSLLASVFISYRKIVNLSTREGG